LSDPRPGHYLDKPKGETTRSYHLQRFIHIAATQVS